MREEQWEWLRAHAESVELELAERARERKLGRSPVKVGAAAAVIVEPALPASPDLTYTRTWESEAPQSDEEGGDSSSAGKEESSGAEVPAAAVPRPPPPDIGSPDLLSAELGRAADLTEEEDLLDSRAQRIEDELSGPAGSVASDDDGLSVL